MKNDKSIVFNNVTKEYLTSKGKYGMLRDMIDQRFLGFLKKDDSDTSRIAALSKVSFDVRAGEAVGIIGKNGAGKSTILKLISRITYPKSGEIKVKGKIAAFIELGAGLHHELTGRENIFLYGAILGMKKNEIKKQFEDIVEFAGIRRFLDIPIKKYSSGMYSRLGFSVCAFSNPDILLVDEVLAVGDAAFQKKCLAKMREFAKKKTIVFVSHDLDAIRSICSKVIFINEGKIVKIGSPKAVINHYLKSSRDYAADA